MQDFDYNVTSTWTNKEDKLEFHTWRSLGSRILKKQLDFFHGSREHTLFPRPTWYLHRAKFRTWDHTKIEGREIKTNKRIKGWAGRAPVSEAEKVKFQELVLCPRSDHDEGVPCETDDGEGLVLLHDRLEKADEEVGATTIIIKELVTNFVPEEIKQMASDAARSWDPVRRRHLRKIA